MPLTCNVGLSKKVGLPDYGSLGATCNVQFELDGTILQTDQSAFHHKVQNAYAACAQAVNDELNRQRDGSGDQALPKNDQVGSQPHSRATNGNGHRATDKQLGYARQLAGQIDGLGARQLDSVCQTMFGKPVADLSTLDASGLIDTLKQVKSGDIDLAAVLKGATP